MQTVCFLVPPEADGLPAKVFLRRFTPVTARLLIACKRMPGGITRRGETLRTIDPVRAGDEIVLQFPPDRTQTQTESAGPLSIVWENDSVWVVDKPYHTVVYPTPGHDFDSLAQSFAAYQRQQGGMAAFRPLYRLDKDTSGLLVLGKDRFSTAALAQKIEKRYLAVCEGILTWPGRIEKPIGLKPGSRIQRCCGQGQYALTEYVPLAHDDTYTLLQCRIYTGRTHQIRVHMASIGHPLAGDDLYGGHLFCIQRQALHCWQVDIPPVQGGRTEHVVAPIPDDMCRAFPKIFDGFGKKGEFLCPL